MIFQNEKYTDNLLSLQLYKNNDMASQIHLTPEETLDWLVKVATADGLLSPTERTTIREFAKSYGIKADVILEAASKSLVGNKPEVEIIDYRAKNGLLFEKLIVLSQICLAPRQFTARIGYILHLQSDRLFQLIWIYIDCNGSGFFLIERIAGSCNFDFGLTRRPQFHNAIFVYGSRFPVGRGEGDVADALGFDAECISFETGILFNVEFDRLLELFSCDFSFCTFRHRAGVKSGVDRYTVGLVKLDVGDCVMVFIKNQRCPFVFAHDNKIIGVTVHFFP